MEIALKKDVIRKIAQTAFAPALTERGYSATVESGIVVWKKRSGNVYFGFTFQIDRHPWNALWGTKALLRFYCTASSEIFEIEEEVASDDYLPPKEIRHRRVWHPRLKGISFWDRFLEIVGDDYHWMRFYDVQELEEILSLIGEDAIGAFDKFVIKHGGQEQ